MGSARSYRFARRPGWLAGHLLVGAAVVTMVLLGRWQLAVSDRKHFSLQNFGYALQWWAFCVFAVAFWLKVLHDTAIGRGSVGSRPVGSRPVGSQSVGSQRPEPHVEREQQGAYRRYVMPNHAAPDDPAITAYNAYLAELAAKDADKGRRT